MNKERIRFYAYLTVTVLGAAVAAIVFFKYLFVAILPFLIAWATAFLLRPAVNKISVKTKIPSKLVSAVLTIVFVFAGLALAAALVFLTVKEAWEFFSRLAADKRVIDVLAKITNPIGMLFGEDEISAEVVAGIENAIKNGLGRLVSILVDLLSVIISSVPKVLFFILVTVIASVYFSLDLEKINSWVKKRLPEKASKALIGLKNGCLSVGFKYVRSYLIIMCITFLIMLFGFMILRVKNVILISAAVAIFDLLPLIGVGTILVPWSIAELLLGNTGVGIGLIVLLVLHEIIRQFAEPKIIGKTFGLHPIISLLLLYIGYSALGFIGILIVPFIAVILNAFFDKKDSAKIG